VENAIVAPNDFYPQVLWILHDFRYLVDGDHRNHSARQHKLLSLLTKKSFAGRAKLLFIFWLHSFARDPSPAPTSVPRLPGHLA